MEKATYRYLKSTYMQKAQALDHSKERALEIEIRALHESAIKAFKKKDCGEVSNLYNRVYKPLVATMERNKMTWPLSLGAQTQDYMKKLYNNCISGKWVLP